MDHLDNLRVVIAVADRHGFAPAARQLSLSAPAVTRAIATLEQRLGVQRLKRSTRSIPVTEIGARFLDDCPRIVTERDEAEAAAGGAHAVPQGRLAITASSMFGRRHVAPVVLDFLALHPQPTANRRRRPTCSTTARSASRRPVPPARRGRSTRRARRTLRRPRSRSRACA